MATTVGFRMRVQLAVLWHVLRRLSRPLISIVAYTLLAALVVRWDMGRAGVKLPDFQATAYGLYTQLFFEPTDPFPITTLSRVIFWITPVVGGFLVAQGLLKVGVSLFDLDARREVWVKIVTDQMRDHVVVCGLGNVGYRVVEELNRLGESIVAIERHATDTFVDVVRQMDIPVHVGDARRDDLLEACGIRRAKAVVCATNDDLANLEIALDAKRMNPRVRVMMRMFDQRLAGKVGGALDLDQSFSTSALAAPLIALQATQRGIQGTYRVGDTVRVTIEVMMGLEAKVDALESKLQCRIIGRRGQGGLVMVKSTELMRPGDVLLVDALASDLASVRAGLGG